MPSFSSRQGLSSDDPPITVREDAPFDLRGLVVDLAYQHGLEPHGLRTIICGVLVVRENPGNWSAFPNIDGEVRDHLDSCDWYHVYDIIESIVANLRARRERGEGETDPESFTEGVNQALRRHGVGWQLRDGRIEIRGEEGFEGIVPGVGDRLEGASLSKGLEHEDSNPFGGGRCLGHRMW